MASQRTYGSGLVRDIELLEVLASPKARSEELGVTRIAELAGRDKAQVSRALATLADAGVVEREPTTGSYRAGWRLFALATNATETQLVRSSAPYLRRVVTGINETTHLCVLRGGKVITLSSELGTHAFRGVGWEGTEVDPYTTSAGRVLMSGWNDDTIREWWTLAPHEAAPSPTPPALPPSPRREAGHSLTLDQHLERVKFVRRSGYAVVDEEFEPGLVGVSAPVHGFHGDIVAAINVSAPKQRLGDHLHAAGEFTRTVAHELSAALGAPTS